MFFTLGLKELPFEPVKRQVIYTEGEYNEEVNRFIQKNYDTIRSLFSECRWEFVYMPKLVKELKTTEIVKYNAPYAEGVNESVTFKNDFLLQYMVHPENKKQVPPSLVYYCPTKKVDDPEASVQYRGITISIETARKNFANIVIDILDDVFDDADGVYDTDVLFSDLVDGVSSRDSNDGLLFRDGDDGESFRSGDDGLLFRDGDDWSDEDDGMMAREEPVDYNEDEDQYEGDVWIMMEEAKAIVDKLKKRGVSEYMLQRLIHGEEKLSRLHITKDYRIFLQDYGMEIEMKPLPKILFLLYINHPEGIYFKDLSDYREELMQYYKGVKNGFISTPDAVKRIERLTTPGDNSVNEKSSHIKAAFISKIKDRLASNYYIVGSRAELRKITLPRELVEWDI
jgi:hypothetical protein